MKIKQYKFILTFNTNKHVHLLTSIKLGLVLLKIFVSPILQENVDQWPTDQSFFMFGGLSFVR